MSTLLSTKFQIPVARPNLVGRPHLVARLADGLRLGRRLTLVSAPPGFGKTTLVREWAAAAGRPVAWLSLDERDDDPLVFVRYIVAAAGQALGLAGQPLPPADAAPELLVSLINELAARGAELLLVLDDYHVVRQFAVHDLVAFLLANQPPGLHVAIVTREDPPLPLARLRARDQLTEVRERALRFSVDEAGAFLGQTMGLGLSATAVASLAARTEGWIAGLQLAGLAMRQAAHGQAADGPAMGRQAASGAAEAFVAAFAGDDRYIVDYLVAEVLDREPEPVRAFLRQTAILERLSAPLCDALTGRDDSQAMLDHLEGTNLFLVPLDNRREWYRYHVLFAEVLRLTLTAGEQIELHRKAALWLESHGLGEHAMTHTRLVSDLVADAAAARRQTPQKQPLVEPLSGRELEVLRLIAAGYSNAEIGRKLNIAGGTVKRHINNIFGKLGVRSRTQAIAAARAMGMVE